MSKEFPDMSQVALEHISLRRMPNQERSRARVEHMLNCAIAVIAEKGSEAMTMSELARLADVSIGSLYQYFPDKSAIIRALAEHYGAECLRCIKDALSEAETLDADCVLVSIGRRPNTEGLGLDAIGLETNQRGQIEIDHEFRTKVDGVWAIGDVVPGPMLAHKAEDEGIACGDAGACDGAGTCVEP